MNALQQFLNKNSIENLRETVNLGGRMKDFPCTIKALPGEEHSRYQQLSIDYANDAKRRKFNTKKFNEFVVINGTVDPNFKDPDWLKENGLADPVKLMYKSLLAGEISTLSERILKLSGFGNDVEEEMEEVKNS